MAEFKDILKNLRNSREWSQQDLADLLHASKQTVSQYERGVRMPSRDNLIALSDIFNVSMDYLSGESDITPRLMTGEEIELLDKYRSLSRDHKDTVLAMIGVLSEREKTEGSSSPRAV